MEITKILGIVALYSWGMCWLGSIMILFSRPHKWCELLIFLQFIWLVPGMIFVEYFAPKTEIQWYIGTYGYPVLLLPVQAWACRKFFSLYKEQKQENEKFLYLTISQIVTMFMLSLLWIILGYVLIWSQAT